MKRYIGPALAAALAIGSTHALALSADNGEGMPHSGDGSGDLVLALVIGNQYAPEQSLVWDLSASIDGYAAYSDLTFNDIIALSEAGVSFSIKNPEVSAFLTPERQARAKWQVFGVANVGTIGDFVNTGDMPTDVGFVMTIDGDVQAISGGNLGQQLLENSTWLMSNFYNGLPDNGVLVASPNQPYSFYSSEAWHGEIIAMQDATGDGLDLTLPFYYLQKDPSRPTDPPLSEYDGINDPIGSNMMPALARQLGSFTFAADGTLSYVPLTAVPVPAAAWMLGSGLLALAGLGRRRRRN